GPWKNAEYVMPEETVPEPPTIITEQETISNFPDRFEVRWEVPNDNGEPITQFEVRYFKGECPVIELLSSARWEVEG
ncbi:hypothetical protein AVEN_107776-1, partial [Araneus ventricosus]